MLSTARPQLPLERHMEQLRPVSMVCPVSTSIPSESENTVSWVESNRELVQQMLIIGAGGNVTHLDTVRSHSPNRGREFERRVLSVPVRSISENRILLNGHRPSYSLTRLFIGFQARVSRAPPLASRDMNNSPSRSTRIGRHQAPLQARMMSGSAPAGELNSGRGLHEEAVRALTPTGPAKGRVAK